MANFGRTLRKFKSADTNARAIRYHQLVILEIAMAATAILNEMQSHQIVTGQKLIARHCVRPKNGNNSYLRPNTIVINAIICLI